MSKLPPQNIEAEQSILSTVLLRPESVPEAVNLISSKEFYNPAHRIIFSAVESLFNDGKGVEIITVMALLREDNTLDEVGGASYLASLISIPSAPSMIESYCSIVADKAKARELITITGEVQEECYSGSNTKDVIDDLGKKFFEVAADNNKSAEKLGNIVDKTIIDIKERAKIRSNIVGLPTGFFDLDKIMLGLCKTDLIIVAGRPGSGKTTFALNIMTNVAKKNGTCLLFSLEMSDEQIALKELSSITKIDLKRLRLGRITDEEWPILLSAQKKLKERNVIIDDSPSLSITQIRARSRMQAARYGLDLVVVDYIQLAKSKSLTTIQQITDISGGLKAIAKELSVPVIALSQLNRECEKRTDKRPIMSDLKESSSIEQDANVILFIYRDDMYNKSPENPLRGKTEIIMPKNRMGDTGKCELFFNGSISSFENPDNNWQT